MATVTKDKVARKVSFTRDTMRPADVTALAASLGAAAAVRAPLRSTTPPAFQAARQYLQEHLRSVGGRPGLSEVDRRKVPVSEPVWRLFEAAAVEMAEPDFHPSAAQVAAAVLSLSARQMLPELTSKAAHLLKASRALAR